MLHEYLPAAQASGMWREELGERLKGLLRPILLHKCHLQARTLMGAGGLSVLIVRCTVAKTKGFSLLASYAHCFQRTRDRIGPSQQPNLPLRR